MVQVGQTRRDHIASGDFSKMTLTVQDNITFREGIPGDSEQDHAMLPRPSDARDTYA